jgi:UDP-3-O-acyl N-acetylglucosamine deacetylase
MPRWTITRSVETVGRGLHTGVTVRLRLGPGASGAGVTFRREDLPGSAPVPAALDRLVAWDRRTTLGSDHSRVETVEHLLAAAYALGVDDLEAVVDGPEVPILDGSFASFAALLEEAEPVVVDGRRRTLRVEQRLDLSEGHSRYRVEPGDGLAVRVTLDYPEPVIGRQSVACRVDPGSFCRELAPARTFGFLAEVEALQARGLLAGAAPDAALVLTADRVLNGPLRWPDEFARHKAGDLVGDLALLAARLDLEVTAERPSHRGNLACARAIARTARLTEA